MLRSLVDRKGGELKRVLSSSIELAKMSNEAAALESSVIQRRASIMDLSTGFGTAFMVVGRRDDCWDDGGCASLVRGDRWEADGAMCLS